MVEQIIRPTGLLDPIIEVRSNENNPVYDLLAEIQKRIELNERVIVCTLTINDAENLTDFLKNKGIKVAYIQHEVKTLERTEIIYHLRKGDYQVVVGINLLREGIDIPEVSLLAILDADKEGFLRSTRSLIQLVGRTARNDHGRVIMYADSITSSMQECIEETERRRMIQEEYNKEHNIIPHTVVKPIKEPIRLISEKKSFNIDKGIKMTKNERIKLISEMEKAMKKAGLRVELDLRNEKISYKVREHSMKKVPVIIAIGKREAAEHTVALRRLGEDKQEVLPLSEAIAKLTAEAAWPHIED